MAVVLPTLDVLGKGFSDLFGKTFKAEKRLQPWVPGPKDFSTVAVYGGEIEGPHHSLWFVDLPASCAMAAALSMLPAATAKASQSNNRLTEALEENFREVMNVASSLLKATEGRVVLQKVLMPPTPIPPEYLQLAAKSKSRLDLSVSLSGYDSGRMLIIGT